MKTVAFQEIVWDQGRRLYRSMPWRDTTDPYRILVSELMLQQTQVDRVAPKYEAFLQRFPSVERLAEASLADVLVLWSGLGYNRRAKFLHASAQKIVTQFGAQVPDNVDALVTLPGVGPNTAAAIMAYSHNAPVSFVETNIRTVYFHHFFADAHSVDDAELLALVRDTLDREHPREWYWALMDYGSFLKKQGAGRLSTSSHYKKQTPLEGSMRQVRGQIVKALTGDSKTEIAIRAEVSADERFGVALANLIAEGLVMQTGAHLHLTK